MRSDSNAEEGRPPTSRYTRLLRLLVGVRTEEPTQRVDVVPVTLWDPDEDMSRGSRSRISECG